MTLARDDEVMSSDYIMRKVADVPRHEIREYPLSHFEMYHGEVQEQVAADHLAFLRRQLMLHKGDVI